MESLHKTTLNPAFLSTCSSPSQSARYICMHVICNTYTIYKVHHVLKSIIFMFIYCSQSKLQCGSRVTFIGGGLYEVPQWCQGF
ncbi:hypothetical protein EB796_012389 [Bugula neritina]|uniref:Uncharacterized protein n=1 Tax=Bugula neritina TaxID=10212 RepID=A0A7J7JUI4_BUGNE|nr:hypothetical protein EB796_012389 [Bugula neritina]